MNSTILFVDKDQMVHVMHNQHELSDRFIAHLLARKIRIEADLIDHLFNSAGQFLYEEIPEPGFHRLHAWAQGQSLAAQHRVTRPVSIGTHNRLCHNTEQPKYPSVVVA
jgi:hypothetical protein